MKKINNFDKVQASDGGFQRLPVGGYIVGVKAVEDVPAKEYLRIEFDVCKGENKNWFQNQYDKDTREDKKWPNAGTLIRSYKENALPMFKGFTTAVEKSNKNFEWNWDETKLKGLKVGILVRDKEYEIDGKHGFSPEIFRFTDINRIREGKFTVPKQKLLKGSSGTSAAASSGDNSAASDDDYPF